jgi:MFS family permease
VVLSEGGSWGWTSPRSLAVIVTAAVLIVLWTLHELRFEHPLVDLRHLRNRSVLTADITGLLMSVSMYLIIPIVIEFVQIPAGADFGFDASILVSGLVFVPLSLGTFLASRFISVYERRFGVRSMIPLGALVSASASLFFAFEHSALWEAFATVGIAGLGIGFTFAAMPGFIIRAVPRSETGSATGFYQVLRNIGLSVGSALGAAVLLGYTRHGDIYPEIGGFRAVLLISAGLGVATAVLSFILPGHVASPRPAFSDRDHTAFDVLLAEEAELAGAGIMLADEHDPTDEGTVPP